MNPQGHGLSSELSQSTSRVLSFDPTKGFDLAEATSWLTLTRLGVLYLVLLVLVLQQVFRPETLEFDRLWLAYELLGINFFLSLVLGTLPERFVGTWVVAAFQVVLDALWISVWLFYAGGTGSPFVLFYLLQILAVSLVLYQQGALLAAVVAAATFSVVIVARQGAMSSWAAYSSLFVIVAVVGGYLSEELRRASASLREKSQRLDRLVEFQERILADIPTGLLTIDSHSVVRYLNPAAEQILELDQSEVTGRQLSSTLPDLLGLFDAMQSEGQTDRLSGLPQTVVLERSGKQKILRGDVADLISKDAYSDAVPTHAAIGRVLLFQDVTKVRQLEEKLRQNEKLAAVGQLAAGIAHEIRNPLASMSASIEMLRESLVGRDVAADERQLMDIAIREIARLNQLVSEFLDYVRPEKTYTDRVVLADILTEIVISIRGALAQGSIVGAKLGHKLPSIELLEQYDHGAVAVGSGTKLRQVIWNFLVNAAQAMTSDGQIKVGCGVRDLATVCFWVEDQGHGMSQQAIARLFEPFFTTKDKGTGLGLATAYKIVEAHGGEISVSSTAMVGTRFEVLLPRAS